MDAPAAVASAAAAAYPRRDDREDQPIMTSFDDRERAFEAEYAHREEMAFRVAARRNRLLGQWAAERMSLTPAEADAYATSIVQAQFEQGDEEDVVRKLVGDLTAAGLEVDDGEVRRAVEAQTIEARRQLMETR